MDYQRKRLYDNASLGEPGPLPADIANLADASLADLSWADPALGYQGEGFVPVAPAPPGRNIAVRDFMRRFTGAQLVAIETASAGDPVIRVYERWLYAGATVDLDAAELAQGLAYLVGLAIITDDDAAAIAA